MSNLHQNILALVYYASGYASSMFMIVHEEMYLRAFGLFIGTYITYNLVNQIESRYGEEKDEDN